MNQMKALRVLHGVLTTLTAIRELDPESATYVVRQLEGARDTAPAGLAEEVKEAGDAYLNAHIHFIKFHRDYEE